MSSKIEVKLYQIAEDLSDIIDKLIDADGVLDEETEAAFDALTGALESKVERCALAVRALDASAAAAKSEADRLAKLASSRANAAKRLKDYIQSCLAVAGTRKIETDIVRVSVVNNSRPSIRWTGTDDAIPDGFVRVKREFDGTAAYDAFKSGETLPEGIEVVTGEHLRIS